MIVTRASGKIFALKNRKFKITRDATEREGYFSLSITTNDISETVDCDFEVAVRTSTSNVMNICMWGYLRGRPLVQWSSISYYRWNQDYLPVEENGLT